MKHLIFILAFLFIVSNISCLKQKQNSENESIKHWFKGNLHTHSYWSDGDEFPEVIMDWYKTNGYHFVALSDHNILAEGDKWVVVSEDSLYQNAFRNYLDTYGSNWVNMRIDSGHTNVQLKTYMEYKNRFEQEGQFLIIQSEEITERFENNPLHVNVTNVKERIDPQGGNSVLEVLQNNIDQVIRQRKETGTAMFPHINHPNYGYGVSLDDMIALKGEKFFEVFNGHPQVHNLGDSTHISTQEMWDRINISYINNNKPLMYGLATDDSHHYHVKGSKWSNAGRGWIMVQTDSLTPSSLINAMEKGQFYATTGVILKDLVFKQNKLFVEVEQQTGVTYTLSFIGCRKGKLGSERFKSIEGFKSDFELTDDILFVRCQITSTKLHNNPIENILYEMAWTQPVTKMP
jgi:hypothetical protein